MFLDYSQLIFSQKSIGEHIASCSTDGRVMITGLYTNENNHSLNAGKPIYSVALDPIFARTGMPHLLYRSYYARKMRAQ